jgi:hypothetical protein
MHICIEISQECTQTFCMIIRPTSYTSCHMLVTIHRVWIDVYRINASRSQGQSQSYVMTDIRGPRPEFLLLSDSCRFVHMGVPSLVRGRVCHLQLLLTFANAVIFTAVKISSTCRLYVQFYISAFYSQSSKSPVSCGDLLFIVLHVTVVYMYVQYSCVRFAT